MKFPLPPPPAHAGVAPVHKARGLFGVARADMQRAMMYPGDVAADGTVLRSLSYTYDRQGRILEDRVVTL